MNVRELKGRTKFESGKFLGYVLWKQSDGFHLRWTTKGGKSHNFQGKLVYQTKLKILRKLSAIPIEGSSYGNLHFVFSAPPMNLVYKASHSQSRKKSTEIQKK